MPATHATRDIFSADGTRLSLQTWSPQDTSSRGTVLVVPGYADHAGRWRQLAHGFAEGGLTTAAVDLRGHGLSDGRRGFAKSVDEYHADITAALAQLDGPVVLLAHSFGALLALDFVSQRAPSINALAVTNPFLALAMQTPAWKVWLGRALSQALPQVTLPSGVPPAFMSRDPEIVDSYARDPLVFTTATAGWFGVAETTQTRVRQLSSVDLPLFYIYSDADPLASPAANCALAEQLTSPDKRVLIRQGELHEVLNELNRAELHETVRDWLLAHC